MRLTSVIGVIKPQAHNRASRLACNDTIFARERSEGDMYIVHVSLTRGLPLSFAGGTDFFNEHARQTALKPCDKRRFSVCVDFSCVSVHSATSEPHDAKSSPPSPTISPLLNTLKSPYQQRCQRTRSFVRGGGGGAPNPVNNRRQKRVVLPSCQAGLHTQQTDNEVLNEASKQVAKDALRNPKPQSQTSNN